MAITISQPIEDVEALFDSLNAKVQTELQDQYDCKKINGPTYADVWSKMMSQVVSQSVGVVFKETEMDRMVKQEQINVAKQDIMNKQETLKLTSRQIKGFDDNLRQKLYDAQMNGWALMFSSGLLESKPEHLNDATVGALARAIENSIGGTPVTDIGYFTQEVVATEGVSGGTSVITWGAVSGATSYTLYISTQRGGVIGYPKSVSASGSDAFVIPTIPDNTSDKFLIKVVAVNASNTLSRTSDTSITVDGPVV